ncbi:hypothetical protein TREES_T100015597 [Tupaia chinensis]|uniref:Uncharacterized protein n=1 Tax=Tupaia chinensis TaxID=246437 RepID=L9L8J5_TUPCH|nr:hypothetical protein TREES_T100015597 [Tupaia chinensis]
MPMPAQDSGYSGLLAKISRRKRRLVRRTERLVQSRAGQELSMVLLLEKSKDLNRLDNSFLLCKKGLLITPVYLLEWLEIGALNMSEALGSCQLCRKVNLKQGE